MQALEVSFLGAVAAQFIRELDARGSPLVQREPPTQWTLVYKAKWGTAAPPKPVEAHL